MHWFASFAVLCLSVAIVGCSDGRLPTFPVSGKVTFPDGSPVRVGTIELKSRLHGIHARGEINANGEFTLSTYTPGDGAVAGTHDCVLVQMVMVEAIPNFRPSTEGVVHPRFGSYSSSKLVVDVNQGQSNTLELTVERLAPSKASSVERPHQHDHADPRREAFAPPAR